MLIFEAVNNEVVKKKNQSAQVQILALPLNRSTT